MTAKAKAKAPAEEPLTLSVEERRRRVQAVRDADKELSRIENALSDALARLPGVLRNVQKVRAVIAENTAPAKAEEPGGEGAQAEVE